MASRYERKQYVEEGIYHVFSRGVNKAAVFHTPVDYRYFIDSFGLYLLPPDMIIMHFTRLGYSNSKILDLASRIKHIKNFSHEIELYAYCLMPNHFHLLLKQKNFDSMTRFLKSILIRYSMYYSLKYDYCGPLFQGRYRGILVQNEMYMNIVTSYIHNNPKDVKGYEFNPEFYPWSSAGDGRHDPFLARTPIAPRA